MGKEQKEQNEKYQTFKIWFKSNGGLQKMINFPARFQPGNYLGLSAQKQIPPNTVILAVPKELTISISTVKQSELKQIINDYDIFSDEDNQDRDYNMICLFLIMEKMKGQKSFYHPYLQLLDSSQTLMNWQDSQIEVLNDPYLNYGFVNAVKKTFDPVFQTFYEITVKYPDIFPNVLERKLFDELYAVVMTRGFGWGLPETMLVPYADFLNHSCSGVNHYVFDKELQESKQKGEYVQKKFQLDLTLFEGMDNRKLLPKDYQRNMRQKYIHQHTQELKKLGISYDNSARMDSNLSNKVYHLLTESVVEDNFEDQVNLSTDSQDNDSEQEDDQEFQQEENHQNSDGDNFEQKNQKKNDSSKQKSQKIKQPKDSNKLKAILMQKKYMKYVYQQVGSGLFQNFTQPKPNINYEFQDGVKFDWWYQSQHDQTKLSNHQNENQNLQISQSEKKDNIIQGSKKREQNYNKKSDNLNKLIEGKYFIVSSSKKLYPGQQIYNCYGRRSNRFLLTWYGFCFENNKYDSVPFRIWSRQVSKVTGTLTWTKYLTEIQYKRGIPIGNNRFNPMMLSEQFRLKKRRINYNLLAYLRFNYLKSHRLYRQHYKSQKIHVNKIVSLQMEIDCLLTYKECLNELVHAYNVDLQCRQKDKQSGNKSKVRMMFAKILEKSNNQIIVRNLLAVNELIRMLSKVEKDFESFVSESESKKQKIKWCIIPKEYLKSLYQQTFKYYMKHPSQQFIYLSKISNLKPQRIQVQLKLMIREYFRFLSLTPITKTLEIEFQ